jgi:hypothetical protein
MDAMILAMHLPILGFVSLAHFHPSSVYYIYATVIAEQFGYGFGFAAFMMYLIYVADGESNLTLLYCYWIYGIRNDASRNGKWIHTRIFRLRKLLYLGVSSHYSWINSVKILDFPTTLERNLKLVNSSDYEVLDV